MKLRLTNILRTGNTFVRSCLTYEKLEEGFYLLCLIATVGLSISCCIEYSKNDDVIQMLVKPFGIKDELTYPDISFCFEEFEIMSKLDSDGSNIDPYEYFDFLGGVFWNGSFPMIDYEKMTWKLENHLAKKPSVLLRDRLRGRDIEDLSSFGSGRYKCFVLGIPPEENVKSLSLSIKKSLFAQRPDGIAEFRLRLHQPKQIFRSWQFDFSNWLSPESSSSFLTKVEINVRDMEVLERRNKKMQRCIEDKAYDYLIIDKILSEVGCAPPYLKNASEFPLCSNEDEMRQIDDLTFNYYHGTSQARPCKEIVKINVDFRTEELSRTEIGKCDATLLDYITSYSSDNLSK